MEKNMKLLILLVDKIKIKWQVKGKRGLVVHLTFTVSRKRESKSQSLLMQFVTTGKLVPYSV